MKRCTVFTKIILGAEGLFFSHFIVSYRMSFELIEPEGNISSSVVEEALTPSTSRRADEKRKDELDVLFNSY